MIIPRACIRCGRPSIPGTSRCKEHGYASGWATYTARYPERAAAYKDPRWKSMRDAQLREYPDCQVRLPGCRGTAKEVDHVSPLALGGAFDGPLRSVCRPCHLKLTAEASKESKRRAAARRKARG